MNKKLIWHLATSAPRILVQLASVAAVAGLASSCVPAKQYDEARSAFEAESASRKQEMQKREAAEARLAALSAELEKKQGELDAERANLAASKLESTVALKDREAASQLVTQLQSDLARAGDHLAWFSSEKRDLGKALLLAQERMDRVERASRELGEMVGVGRDLALLLGENQGMGELSLGAQDGRLVLEAPEGRLFAEGADALVVDAASVLAAIARAANDHQSLKLTIAAPGASELETRRAARLMTALADRGLLRERMTSEVIELAPAKADAAEQTAPASPRLYSFRFSP
jgi:flagellar motor protein MotB